MTQPITLPTLTCLRCGHTWTPRQPVVWTCPKCSSAKWNVPRDEETKS
jgi:Zn finger protein HypA/HybF involved in hydrogenase expression